jgi:two-component system, NarL family, response regulator LiaR
MVERAVVEQAQLTPQKGASAEGKGRPAPIRLVIVDDHSLVREGTAQLLKQSADFDVVGQAGSGEDGLAVLEQLQPDVALIDVHLPQMSGLELARAAASSCPSVKVLILSAYDDYAYVSEALEIGVGGYLLKTATTKELVDAVRAVADGILVLDRRVADRLTRRGRSASPPGSGLTPREADILPLLARGRSNKQIATELRLGLRTVEGHVSSVLAKLGVASRAEAVAYALSHRLVVPENPGDSPDVG